jgi:hypothetical protein
MPTNDYLTYMRQDISKHLERDVAEEGLVQRKETQDVGLDPIP